MLSYAASEETDCSTLWPNNSKPSRPHEAIDIFELIDKAFCHAIAIGKGASGLKSASTCPGHTRAKGQKSVCRGCGILQLCSTASRDSAAAS